jgi:hypothetical protein
MAGRIFISYSRKDAEVASHIAAELTAIGLNPWIDRNEIRPGESFVGALNTAVSEASYLLVLFSRETANSDWVSREWMSAMANRVPIFPVRLDDSEPPAILRDIQYFDLRGDLDAGVGRIVEFFRTETRPVQTGASRTVTESPLKSATRRQIRLVAIRCIDEAGLSSFCFDAEIDPKSLRGNSVQEHILSLLHSVANDGLTTQFANWILIEKRRCVENRVRELQAAGEWNWNL